jgi:transcriptional regulator with XRE-family HTH domain
MARPQTPAHAIPLVNAGQAELLRVQDMPSALLAKRLGVTPAAIYQYRTGRSRPSGEVVRALATIYPTCLVWLWDFPAFRSEAERSRALRLWSRAS